MFKGERKRPIGGMNASCWRKMCKDVQLWKDLAKASLIFEEVTRGQRAMDFDLFTHALALAAERKNVTASDMNGFIQHVAASYSQGGGDDSSVNSMGSGGSLNSIGSVGSMSSITSGRIRRKKKGIKSKRKGNRKQGGQHNPGFDVGKSNKGDPHFQGIATTSILEESKDSRESSPSILGGMLSPMLGRIASFAAQDKVSSKKPLVKSNDSKAEYEKRIRSTLEAINTSLYNRDEFPKEELESTGFSWEVKEHLCIKIQEDPTTWGWAADGE